MPPGSYSLFVEIDPANDFAEGLEGNNLVTAEYVSVSPVRSRFARSRLSYIFGPVGWVGYLAAAEAPGGGAAEQGPAGHGARRGARGGGGGARGGSDRREGQRHAAAEKRKRNLCSRYTFPDYFGIPNPQS